MKIAFDEHVPPALAKAFLALAKEGRFNSVSAGLTIQMAKDYAPTPNDPDYVRKSDAPWLDRFAAAGGRAVISGDVKMREKHHEKMALYENGFVAIFFERQWSNWSFFQKSALLLHWWEEVADKIRNAEKGTFWVVPAAWPIAKRGELRNASLGLAQLLKDNPKIVKKVTKKRARLQPEPKIVLGQANLLENLEAEYAQNPKG